MFPISRVFSDSQHPQMTVCYISTGCDINDRPSVQVFIQKSFTVGHMLNRFSFRQQLTYYNIFIKNNVFIVQ